MHFALLLLILLTSTFARAAEPRPVAPWPPPEGKPLRMILDADMANEIDDQFATALALGNPDRLKIEGVVAAHFGDPGGPKGLDKSLAETDRVLDRAGMKGKIPVFRGADPFTYMARPPESEGVRFIIDKAKTATPDDPIWLVLLGPATDAAAALLTDPSIADRLIVFWHGRSAWPNECRNFNATNDPKAARLLFSLKCRLVLFDTGTHLTMPPDEAKQRLAPLGPLGAYLSEIRSGSRWGKDLKKGIFDLGDIAALVDPSCVKFERVEAPTVTDQLKYDFKKPQGEIVRISDVDRDRSFVLLEDALKRVRREQQGETR
jgi:inosine-uridine nucleoside N-ribohydrolase